MAAGSHVDSSNGGGGVEADVRYKRMMLDVKVAAIFNT